MMQLDFSQQSMLTQQLLQPFLAVSPTALAIKVIQQMNQARISHALILQQQVLVGIFTQGDILQAIATARLLDNTLIAELMTTPVITLSEANLEITSILNLFHQHPISHLPIVALSGEVVGLVTRASLIQQIDRADSSQSPTGAILSDQKPAPSEIRTAPAHSTAESKPGVPKHGIAAVRRFRVFADRRWEYDYFSSTAESLYGYTPQELMTDPWLWDSRIPAEAREQVFTSLLQQVFAECEAAILTYPFRHKDGLLRWISSHLTSHRDEELDCWVVMTIDTDSSDRQQMEQAWQQQIHQLETELREHRAIAEAIPESQVFLRLILDSVPQAIFWKDRQSTYLGCNRNFAEAAGLSLEQVVGKTDYDLPWKREEADWYRTCDRRVMETEQAQFRIIETLQRADGQAIWLETSKVPFRNSAGEVIGILGTFEDITERRNLEISLRLESNRNYLLWTTLQRIRQSLNLNEILNTAVEEIQQFLQADRVLLYRLNPGLSGTVMVESLAPGWNSILNQTIVDPCFSIKYIKQYAEGKVKALSNIYTDRIAPCYAQLLASFQVQAVLIVPVFQEKDLWGLLIVHQCAGPREWTLFETKLLQQLSVQIGIAIQQSQLHEEVQRLNDTLEQQVQIRTMELEQSLTFEATLKRISDKVRDSLDQHQILQAAVEELAKVLEVDGCHATICSLEPSIPNICYQYTLQGMVPIYERNLLIERYPEVYQQLHRGQEFIFCQLEFNALQHYSVILACPIFDDQGFVGDLWVFRPTPSDFKDVEIRLVKQVANQCAIAIRQAQLYAAAQKQVQELERLNQLKDDFLNTVSHELRTPMSNIQMTTQMLELSLHQLGVLRPENSSIQSYFDVLKHECSQEIRLINDLLELTRLEAGTVPLLPISIALQVWISHLTESWAIKAQEQHHRLEVMIPSNLPPLTTDFSYLERILTELVNNACKYTPAGEQITITAVAIAKEIQISISNTGIEIPPEEYKRIFDKFYRIPNHDPWKYAGTGLGLALIKKLVHLLQGKISVSSGQNTTTFTVHLPQHLSELTG